MQSTVERVTKNEVDDLASSLELLRLTLGDEGLMRLIISHGTSEDEQINAENYGHFNAFWGFLLASLFKKGWGEEDKPESEEYQSAARLFRRLKPLLQDHSHFMAQRVIGDQRKPAIS